MLSVWCFGKCQQLAVSKERGPFRVSGGMVNKGCCGLDAGTATGFLAYFRFNLDKKESRAGKREFIACSNLLLVRVWDGRRYIIRKARRFLTSQGFKWSWAAVSRIRCAYARMGRRHAVLILQSIWLEQLLFLPRSLNARIRLLVQAVILLMCCCQVNLQQ